MTTIGRLHLSIALMLCAAASLGQTGHKDEQALEQAKADYAKLKLNPAKPVAKQALSGAAQECVAEVNSRTPIDVACAIPSNATYTLELYAKNGVNGENGFNWKTCQTSGDFLCPGANGSWFGLGELPEEAARKAIQIRIVPFKCDGSYCDIRGRLRVLYQIH